MPQRDHSELDIRKSLTARQTGAVAVSVGAAVLVFCDVSPDGRPVPMGVHVEYRLSVWRRDARWDIVRRFREFAALHSKLRSCVPSSLLPKLPSRNILRSTQRSKSLVEQRRQALHKYCGQLCRLVNSPAGSSEAWRALLDFVEPVEGSCAAPAAQRLRWELPPAAVSESLDVRLPWAVSSGAIADHMGLWPRRQGVERMRRFRSDAVIFEQFLQWLAESDALPTARVAEKRLGEIEASVGVDADRAAGSSTVSYDQDSLITSVGPPSSRQSSAATNRSLGTSFSPAVLEGAPAPQRVGRPSKQSVVEPAGRESPPPVAINVTTCTSDGRRVVWNPELLASPPLTPRGASRNRDGHSWSGSFRREHGAAVNLALQPLVPDQGSPRTPTYHTHLSPPRQARTPARC